MKRWVPWAVGAGLLALLFSKKSYSFGGPELRAGIDRDPKKLLPGFADKVEKLFQRMRARGFNPLLWEGYRTPERAAALHAANPTGAISDSIHSYGGAVDIVDGAFLPEREGVSPGFWTALGEETEKLALTWGGRFSNHDVRHVQGVSVREQNAFRSATPSERASMVA